MAFDAAVRPVKPAVRCGRVVEPTANLQSAGQTRLSPQSHQWPVSPDCV